MAEKNIDPESRAKELHSLIKNKVARSFVTIAVLTTETETVIVGTNERKLREEQKDALFSEEIEAETHMGKHAEENVIAFAKKIGLEGKEIGVSRPICLDCENLIKEEGILAKTIFKGKKSKNRQS